jgi:hypothetical protein
MATVMFAELAGASSCGVQEKVGEYVCIPFPVVAQDDRNTKNVKINNPR